MTTVAISIGASSAYDQKSWQLLPWTKVKTQVLRLQMRIAKANREKKKGKVKALQRILTHSFYGKCLAVKRITSNSGSKTPGVDDVIWRTDLQKIKAVSELKRRGYQPLPLKRIYISKKPKGKYRPLSIPSSKDRAMQMLWQLALNPIAEEWADHNAYGFRPKRSAHDAIDQCFKVLGRKKSAKWILEGDIKSCFDKISIEWLLGNIPMDKVILRKFLKAGYMENNTVYPAIQGTAQGGPISPTLAVMALSGLERKLQSPRQRTRNKEKINFVAYADDFVVTASSKELLQEKVMPIIEEHLKKVGLELSQEKTKITHIEEGFDFLGFNIRKYDKGKLLIKPSKAGVKAFLHGIRQTIKANYALSTDKLIYLLNQKIIGWTNYYRSVVSSKTFSYIDYQIHLALKLWLHRKHPNKGKRWVINKYYTRKGLSNWRFYTVIKDKEGNKKLLHLRLASETKIRRHTKILANANPFNPCFKEYFKRRDKLRKSYSNSNNNAEFAGLRCIQPY